MNNLFGFMKSGAGAQSISASEVKKRIADGEKPVLVDVRSPAEHTQAHIPNSMLLPVDILGREAEKVLTNKSAVIVVYCASGMRSRSAASTLTQMGYTNVFDLGGLNRWPYGTVSGN